MAAGNALADGTGTAVHGYPGFRWLVLILASLGLISWQMVNQSVSPLVPLIAASLHTDPGTATNALMTSFLVSGCLMWTLLGGYVCDRYGVFVSLILGFLCLAAPGSLMPMIGVSTTGIFWARMIQGLSLGFMFPPIPAIVSTLFPSSQKGLANGLMNSSVSVGASAGVFLGPLVLKAVHGEWKSMSATISIFVWACMVLGLILFAFFNSKLPNREAPADEAKGSAFKMALVSPFTIVGIMIFFLTAWAMHCLYGLTGAYLAADRPLGAGDGAMTAGQLMLGVTLLAGVTGPILSGFLLDKVFRGSAKPMLLVGYFLMCVFVYALISSRVIGGAGLLEVTLIFAGYGTQFAITTIWYLVANSYPPQIVGKMSGLWGGIGSFGGVLGLYIAGLTVKSQGSYHTTLYLQSFVALIAFVLTFALFALKKRLAAA